MTRIIAGYLGSLQLKSAAKATRPTSDRVKESLFSRLEAMELIEGSVVLDLFAGTGALGFESLSRGAKSATLVEKDRAAATLLNQNATQIREAMAKANLDSKLLVYESDAKKFLGKEGISYDLVFIDPPYDFGDAALGELVSQLEPLLNPGAVIVVERSSKSKAKSFEGFDLISDKKYGDTAVYLYEWAK